MYKIYINENLLVLANRKTDLSDFKSDPTILITEYLGKTKAILQYIDMLAKDGKAKTVVLVHDSKKFLRSQLFSLVDVIEAGGGLVFNENQEALVIFRRGFWDLPKGKLEKLESKRQAALREVMEETGLKSIEIVGKIGKTYHLFRKQSGKRVIKLSHWYYMRSQKQELIPQAEEDIEKAEWVSQNEFLSNYSPCFKNILDVFNKYEKKYLNISVLKNVT